MPTKFGFYLANTLYTPSVVTPEDAMKRHGCTEEAMIEQAQVLVNLMMGTGAEREIAWGYIEWNGGTNEVGGIICNKAIGLLTARIFGEERAKILAEAPAGKAEAFFAELSFSHTFPHDPVNQPKPLSNEGDDTMGKYIASTLRMYSLDGGMEGMDFDDADGMETRTGFVKRAAQVLLHYGKSRGTDVAERKRRAGVAKAYWTKHFG